MTEDAVEVAVVVSVDDDHLDSVPQVAERLKAAGMAVDDYAAELGTVTGTVRAAALESLSGVEGVAHVERSREIRLPPPDAEVQ